MPSALLFLAMLFAPTAQAKEGFLYLYRFYSEADIVANVAVLRERDVEKNLVEYELKILKPIKGVATEKTLKATLPKVRPVDGPHMADVGMVFLKQEGNRLSVIRFIAAEDFVVSTKLYLCKPPEERCQFTKLSEIEAFFKSR